ITLTNNNAIALNNNLTFIGTKDLSFGSGTVIFTAARTIVTRAGTLTVGPLNGGGTVALTKQGSGTLVAASASNSYSDTNLQGGVLDLRSTGVLGSAGGAVNF